MTKQIERGFDLGGYLALLIGSFLMLAGFVIGFFIDGYIGGGLLVAAVVWIFSVIGIFLISVFIIAAAHILFGSSK